MKESETETSAAAGSAESSDLFGNLFRDRDGDIGVGLESKPDHQGVPWIKLKYRNGRTSWMPSTFLTEVEARMPLDAALELADRGSDTGGIMTNEALKSLAKGVRDLHAIARELSARLEDELNCPPTVNKHMAGKAIKRLTDFLPTQHNL